MANLQQAIAMEYPIPEDKQVLLISGGESLDPAATVGKYHAGTVRFISVNPVHSMELIRLYYHFCAFYFKKVQCCCDRQLVCVCFSWWCLKVLKRTHLISWKNNDCFVCFTFPKWWRCSTVAWFFYDYKILYEKVLLILFNKAYFYTSHWRKKKCKSSICTKMLLRMVQDLPVFPGVVILMFSVITFLCHVQYFSPFQDTNPIFLFSKSTIEAQHPPSPSVHYGSGTWFFIVKFVEVKTMLSLHSGST